METLKFSYNTSLIAEEELRKKTKILQNEIENIKAALKKDYADDRAAIKLLSDRELLKNVKILIDKKRKLKPTYLVIVGIGGSNLGTVAVQEAILGKMYNLKNPEIKVLYADTVDSDNLNDIVSILEPELKKGENIIVNVISKSGGTTETIANFEILVNLLRNYRKDYLQYIVVTTDRNSRLWNLAVDKDFDVLEIPKKVGGRFSVFSPVGLFPLGLIGVKIDELLEGAQIMRDKCLLKDIKNNPGALSAILIYLHSEKSKNIHDLFIFSPDFESIGKWYRQLMGESIGKEFNRENKQVYNGITPTVSIGSTDLHSMAQLYLGGPYDKFTTFIRIEKNKADIMVPDFSEYLRLVEGIQGSRLGRIMNAILKGVQTSFIKGKRPFVEITLPDKSAFSIGQFLQMKMMEIMYLGYLMNVNPFDQPNVEDYKIETKKILEGRI